MILIGIDDTDNETSPGTGALARALAAECVRRGLGPAVISRHQFLLDPRIPFTSHNSGACAGIDSPGPAEDFLFATDFVAERSAAGSDPGVCIAAASDVTSAVVEFGWLATREVVTTDEARRVAGGAALRLNELGGAGLGVIGALASVGLRACGDEGRIIDLPGLRDLPERVGLECLTRLGIVVRYESERRPCPQQSYETLHWVRPRLEGGRMVWPVEWSEDRDAWIPVDRKRSRPLA